MQSLCLKQNFVALWAKELSSRRKEWPYLILQWNISQTLTTHVTYTWTITKWLVFQGTFCCYLQKKIDVFFCYSGHEQLSQYGSTWNIARAFIFIVFWFFFFLLLYAFAGSGLLLYKIYRISSPFFLFVKFHTTTLPFWKIYLYIRRVYVYNNKETCVVICI